MLPSLPPTIQHELHSLAERYGPPLIHTADIPLSQRFDPLSKTDRYGEVCMVVRRPNGNLLTMTKTYYPQGAFRLLTGGINHGEAVFDALLRETQEETGLQVRVERFLCAIAYQSPDQEQPVFYTFAFLLDEIGGTLGAIDENEEVDEFREVAPADLLQIAENLERVTTEYSSTIDGTWSEWGHFRAIVHRVTYEALQA